MADNRITPNEADAIARACQQVMAALVQVSQHAEAAAEREGMNATAKAMIHVRQIWYLAGCLLVLKGAA